MQERLKPYIATSSPRAKSTLPYLHRTASEESKKYINCSESHRTIAKTLKSIVARTKFDTSDEALVALAYQYYRLASLPELNDNNSQKMLMILSLAEIDVTLSNLINSIDAFLATQATLNETTLSSSIINPNSTLICKT